jgi:hypothetical protein
MAMQLELTPEDRELLKALVERGLAETRVESRHTADRAWRDHLHGEQQRLRDLLERLGRLA